jgi:hypothetical protein
VADEANGRFWQLCEPAYKDHHPRIPNIAVLIEKVFTESIQYLPFFNLHHVQNQSTTSPYSGRNESTPHHQMFLQVSF